MTESSVKARCNKGLLKNKGNKYRESDNSHDWLEQKMRTSLFEHL